MDHADHVALIRNGVIGAGPTWADLGSGDGAFTLALAELLGPGSTIFSIDRDSGALRRQAQLIAEQFPPVELRQAVADFTDPLDLPPLDGIVMANSLHFVRDQVAFLTAIIWLLRPEGHFVLVEYDAEHGNPWVPFPVSYRAWQQMAPQAGLRATRRLAAVPSRFLGSIYSALSVR